MNEPEPRDPLLMDHNYDGIEEYDNPMPRWWLWLFYLTIIYSVLYWFNVPGIGIGRGRIAQYEADVARARESAAAAAALEPAVTGDELMALSRDLAVEEQGERIFGQMCASCHAPDGGGLIGPNLPAEYWIHGGTPLEIYHTVEGGVLEKGMPAWGKMISPADLKSVVAYVLSIKGTTPANPKAPEGQPTVAADTGSSPVP